MNERKTPLLYIALALAGACLLVMLMLAAFLAGFLASGMLEKYRPGFPPLAKLCAGYPKCPPKPGADPKLMGTVAVIPGKGGAQFTSQVLKLPAGHPMVWINKTSQTQVLIGDNNSQNLTLAPGQPTSTFFKQGGQAYTWHLASNPNASITVYIAG